MASDKQIEANRLNAQKSTGPTSPEGKAHSSMNALKSGIDAKSLIIRGENPEALQTLAVTYFDRWTPTTPEQRLLVDSLIINEWLLRRYLKVETQLWHDSMPDPERFDDRTYLCKAFGYSHQRSDRIMRHKNSLQRNFHAALRDLERLKAAEAKAEAQPPSEPAAPQPLEEAPVSPQIGFVSHPAISPAAAKAKPSISPVRRPPDGR
jgi:hypothetical protein